MGPAWQQPQKIFQGNKGVAKKEAHLAPHPQFYRKAVEGAEALSQAAANESRGFREFL